MNKVLLFIVFLFMALSQGCDAFAQKVVAHRGYWNTDGSAQNSSASLNKAYQEGCWGTEFDVWITKDGVCVVNHDAEIDGVRIEASTYSEIRDKKLRNGETMPVLEQYLWWGSHVAPMRLILEIKSHSTNEANNLCVDEVLRLVKKYDVVGRTDFISFNLNVCERLASLAPKVLTGPTGQRNNPNVECTQANVAYLGGDKTPSELNAKGINGIDYEQGILKEHPEWIQECHTLGMTVNSWTVNDLNTVWDFRQKGVDIITTDRPVEVMKLTK